MCQIWSEQGKLSRWLEVELAALDGLGRAGRRAGGRFCLDPGGRTPLPSAERVAEVERTTDHDVAAFVDAVGSARPDGRWLHYGLTSSDVVDTALALSFATPVR